MKALYFDGVKLDLQEDYQMPDSKETLVKVKLAGICGTDLEILKGYASLLEFQVTNL
jgi:threonine dehydrogenase-like Zn-dependent dehydrogenase